jgi:hypothetical protein
MNGQEPTMGIDMSNKESIDRAHPTPPPDADMVDDDATTQATGGSGKNKVELHELCVNWCLEGATDKKKVKADLAAVLLSILKAFPEELFVLDNSHQELHYHPTKNRPETITIQKLIDAQFTIHEANSTREQKLQRWTCVHKLMSSVSLSTIKQHGDVFKMIKSVHAYANVHHFEPSNWDISHLGFLRDFNVKHLHKAAAKIKLQRDLLSTSDAVPNFELTNARVKSHKKASAFGQTQSYEIQCTKLLKSGPFRKTLPFVPYSLKRTNPEAFLKAIQQQNAMLNHTWVVKIEGFTSEAIECIRPTILKYPGVSDIVPTYNGSDRGAWKILLHQNQFKKFRKWLATEWEMITSIITAAATANKPPTHPLYSVTSAAGYESEDDDDDEDSYATAFSNAMSAASLPEEDWNLELPPELPRGPNTGSYADVVTHGSISSQMSKLTQGTSRTGRGGSGRGSRGQTFIASPSTVTGPGGYGTPPSEPSQQTQNLLAALEKANADRDRDRLQFETRIIEMQQANEANLKTKADESTTLQSQVLQLTNSMAAQSVVTSELTRMVKEMLAIQSGVREGPSTPKRRAVSQPPSATDNLASPVVGQDASNQDHDDPKEERETQGSPSPMER